MIKFEDLCEDIPEELKAPLDRHYEMPHSGLFYAWYQPEWIRNGVVIFEPFELITEEQVDRYCERFIRDRPPGKSIPNWKWDTPFTEIEEIRDLCLNPKLMEVINNIIGFEMAINLNLINWTSTERSWHMDDYLNPEYLNSHYLAVWFALDDIHPDSGPFMYVPGSHKWGYMRRSKVFEAAPAEMKADPQWDKMWPALSESFVVPACEEKIQQEGLPVREFIAKKGQVLIWHGLLMHCGSYPKVRGLERRALISHYSSIEHRRDMPRVAEHKPGFGRYFIL